MRAAACRDAVLDWLYKEKHAGTATPLIANFLRDPRSYFEGSQFEQTEIDNATGTLKERGFISGSGSWGGGVMRPTLRAAGQEIVEEWGGSIAAYVQGRSSGGTSMHQHNYPGAQGAMAGRDVHQVQINTGLQVDDILPLLFKIRAEAAGLPAEQAKSVTAVVQVLEDEMGEAEPDRTIMAKLGNKLAGLVGAVGSAGLVAAVKELVPMLMS